MYRSLRIKYQYNGQNSFSFFYSFFFFLQITEDYCVTRFGFEQLNNIFAIDKSINVQSNLNLPKPLVLHRYVPTVTLQTIPHPFRSTLAMLRITMLQYCPIDRGYKTRQASKFACLETSRRMNRRKSEKITSEISVRAR